METDKPKYRVLTEWIQEQIHSGAIAPGEKFYSEHTLGKMFGISRQTVRQAIGILQSEGYLEGRRGSGTYVTWRPEASPGKTMAIGVITTYADDYIFPPIIRGIGKVLSQNRYVMQLAITLNRVENETKALQDMLSRGVDGVIVEPTKSGLPNPNLDIYRQMATRDIPILFFNACYQGLPFPHVSLDDWAAGRLATRHLIQAGHLDIAGLFQSDDLQGHLRYAGYLEALQQAGISVNAQRILWFTTEDIPHLFENGARVMSRIGPATAVVCYNDQIAAQLLVHLKAHGASVPRDISLVSIDNSALAEHSWPPLTSVDHPKEILGKTVAENLLKKIKNPAFDAGLEFEPKLAERASVRTLKRHADK